MSEATPQVCPQCGHIGKVIGAWALVSLAIGTLAGFVASSMGVEPIWAPWVIGVLVALAIGLTWASLHLGSLANERGKQLDGRPKLRDATCSNSPGEGVPPDTLQTVRLHFTYLGFPSTLTVMARWKEHDSPSGTAMWPVTVQKVEPDQHVLVELAGLVEVDHDDFLVGPWRSDDKPSDDKLFRLNGPLVMEVSITVPDRQRAARFRVGWGRPKGGHWPVPKVL